MTESAVKSLLRAVRQAPESVNTGLEEEQGGFILRKQDEFLFVQVRNANTGTPSAPGLYTADAQEYGEKVIKLELTGGWKLFATFHTHPTNCSPWPSGTDVGNLFKSAKVHFIFAPWCDELNCFVYSDKHGRPDGTPGMALYYQSIEPEMKEEFPAYDFQPELLELIGDYGK